MPKVGNVPHLTIEKYSRRGDEWHVCHCSECRGELHETARFCVHCGAWFKKGKS